MELNFEKLGGLIPAIAQDERDGRVLMLGFMNEDAFQKSLESRRMTFFSRSRQRLWTKGETSGNSLLIQSWALDCDADSLLFRVKAQGPTCHRGSQSCFQDDPSAWNEAPSDLHFLKELEATIQTRKMSPSLHSYTTRLLAQGTRRIAQKIGEEGVETALALSNGSQDEFINESADLLFHLLVGLSSRDLSLKSVVECLQSRRTDRSPAAFAPAVTQAHVPQA